MPQPDYVQERLKSLDKIDTSLCNTLHFSNQVVSTLIELKRNYNGNNDELKLQFQKHVVDFYKELELATVSMRREIKTIDENIGIRLLPIQTNKKAVDQDNDKLREQFEYLDKLLNK